MCDLPECHPNATRGIADDHLHFLGWLTLIVADDLPVGEVVGLSIFQLDDAHSNGDHWVHGRELVDVKDGSLHLILFSLDKKK